MKHFLDKVIEFNMAVQRKDTRLKVKAEALEARERQKYVKAEVKKQLPILKRRICAAAKQGEHYIDLFPTGRVGDALLEKLGPGFRADTSTQRLVGVSDGQGSYEGPYCATTRLIWSDQS